MSKLDEHIIRYPDGMLDVQGSLQKLSAALRHRLRLEKIIGEVLAEVLKDFTNESIPYYHLYGMVVRHPKLARYDNLEDAQEIIFHHIEHNPFRSVIIKS